jgi:signal transduction histidine kinase
MRRVVALAIGLVLSTLLLGGGWLVSSLRMRDARIHQARERLVQAADAVRAAVDESLEELREREDAQPFYLYNYFYSPPDVIAITDPVAISPLARAPRDPRIVGHFSIAAGGNARTPYTPDDRTQPPPLAQRILRALAREEFRPIADLAAGDELGTMLARPRMMEGMNEAAIVGEDEGDASTSEGQLAIRAFDGADTNEEGVVASNQATLLDLNPWAQEQAEDIEAAQAGDQMANMRVMERGRQVPRISRRNVTWEEQLSQQAPPQQAPAQVPPPQQSAEDRQQARSAPMLGAPTQGDVYESDEPALPHRPLAPVVRRALESLRPDVEGCTPASPLIVRVTVRGTDGRAARTIVEGTSVPEEVSCVRAVLSQLSLGSFSARSLVVRYAYRESADFACGDGGCDPLDAAVPQDLGLGNMVQREAEIDYTPMAYRQVGDALILHRLISHGGASMVQGVFLDRDHLERTWIPSVVERRSEGGAAPSVTPAGRGECAVRRPASDIVSGVDLCFAPSVLSAATAELDRELEFQIGALAALWLIALIAASAIVLAARRAEALSRQKSAFVSAVSHELRTPLTTLRMHAEMLEEGLVTEERRPKVHAELVRESVRLARLVDNVLSISRLEEGRRRIMRTDGDLAAHVREVALGQKRFVEERGFTLRAPDAEAVEASFDRQAIEQIVVNLLDNAVKYGAGEEKSIEVSVALLEGKPTISVRDRGPGIPVAERRKVFERFHRVERPEHAHAPGTGIGLALVDELARAHGGDATVHPREGGGLEVRVRLGIAPSDAG